MRSISSNSLAKLSTNTGTEPINIIEIQWVDDGPRVAYADRTLTGAVGAILEVGTLDDTVQVSGGSQSQSISIKLNDTDGSLKNIIDTIDVHKRPCWVYQWFDGIPLSDKFLIFKGVLNTPIEWNEGDRTLSFDVVSQIEDVEVGFSIEEGDFTNPPAELIGKPWPLVFGSCTNVPALRTASPRSGILATGLGIRDFTLEEKLDLANKITCPLNFTGFVGGIDQVTHNLNIVAHYETDNDCLKQRCEAIESLKLQLSEQKAAEASSVRIFGGENFPQNTVVTLNINGGKFTGTFSGETFTITGRVHPQDDGSHHVIVTDTQKTIQSKCPGENDESEASGPGIGAADGVFGQDPVLGAKASRQSFDRFNALKQAQFFFATAGSTVTLDHDEEILYIVNLLPSTILRVAAFRDLNGGHQLITVPSEYYTIQQTNYTGYTGVVELVFKGPLSNRDLDTGGGWSDDIYVTLTSTVGPNTVDILTWFIQTYTQHGIDATSFNSVRALIDNYPMHFPLLERKNITEVLEEIAFQARCALSLRDDTFFIKYLAAEPDVDETITQSEVLPNTLVLQHTPTEELVTKYIATWKQDHANPSENTVILRHNVKKYGLHEQTYDFYCFNLIELVRKAATFWLIRKANTWRRVVFSTPLNHLRLETFDTVALSLADLTQDTSVKGIIEQANYDSENHSIAFQVWMPVKSGSQTPYNFAWPADIDESDIFPTLEERELGLAGSGSAPNFTVIAPAGHALANPKIGVSGFALACNGGAVTSLVTGQCRPDFGTKKPSDRGDTKPSPPTAPDDTGGINVGTSPITPPSAGSGCCDDALKKANDALQQSQKALQEAQRAASAANAGSGSGSSGGNSDGSNDKGNPDQSRGKDDDPMSKKLKKLPKPKDLPKDGCQIAVVVTWFQTQRIHDGGQYLCVPVPGSDTTETFIFNSSTAAEAFAESQRNGNSNCTGKPECVRCVQVSGGDQTPRCEPGGDTQQAMIAYDNDNASGNSIFDPAPPEDQGT